MFSLSSQLLLGFSGWPEAPSLDGLLSVLFSCISNMCVLTVRGRVSGPNISVYASFNLFMYVESHFFCSEIVCVELNWPSSKRNRWWGLIGGAVGVFEYIALMVDDSV